MNLPTYAQKFKELREELGFTQQDFAQLCNIGKSTIDIERGKTKLSGKLIATLIDKFNINPLWLYGNSAQKYLKTSSMPNTPQIITVDPSGNENTVLVNAKAAAGYPHNISDHEWYKALPALSIPLPQFRNGSYRGFEVKGDSMLPYFKDKDWVISKAVFQINEVRKSKFYVIVLKDSVLIKKLAIDKEKTTLISANPEYAPIQIQTNEIKELWEVNSKLTFDFEPPTNTLEHVLENIKQLQQQVEKLRR